ncbi:MAG: S-ribosylhomocysteine lyase [Firmicutes bacterium]|nr:S-ribosylhomocysteine lyase [Bacillota bacterium]
MKTIASFTIDHMRLLPGIYVSRKDSLGEDKGCVTTFDVRMTRPNFEPVMNTAEIHALEHLGATFLRNHSEWASRIIYFGPMGCRTGFYLIVAGDLTSKEIAPLVKEMMEFIQNYEGDIPGASAVECGNYLDLNLDMAKYWAKRFIEEVLEHLTEERLQYPQ